MSRSNPDPTLAEAAPLPGSRVAAAAAPRAAARLRGLAPYGYLLPSLVFLTVFTYGPLLVAATLSLFRWNILTPRPVFVGLRNYLQMAGDPLFWLVLRNNLFYALGTIPVTIALALNFQKIREILIKQLDDAVDGKVTAAQAMETVQKQVEAATRQ